MTKEELKVSVDKLKEDLRTLNDEIFNIENISGDTISDLDERFCSVNNAMEDLLIRIEDSINEIYEEDEIEEYIEEDMSNE